MLQEGAFYNAFDLHKEIIGLRLLFCLFSTRPKIGFQDQLLLNEGQKYCRMLQEGAFYNTFDLQKEIIGLRLLFCLFLSGHLRQVLL